MTAAGAPCALAKRGRPGKCDQERSWLCCSSAGCTGAWTEQACPLPCFSPLQDILGQLLPGGSPLKPQGGKPAAAAGGGAPAILNGALHPRQASGGGEPGSGLFGASAPMDRQQLSLAAAAAWGPAAASAHSSLDGAKPDPVVPTGSSGSSSSEVLLPGMGRYGLAGGHLAFNSSSEPGSPLPGKCQRGMDGLKALCSSFALQGRTQALQPGHAWLGPCAASAACSSLPGIGPVCSPGTLPCGRPPLLQMPAPPTAGLSGPRAGSWCEAACKAEAGAPTGQREAPASHPATTIQPCCSMRSPPRAHTLHE